MGPRNRGAKEGTETSLQTKTYLANKKLMEAGEAETGEHGEAEAQPTQQQHVQSCEDKRRAATQGRQETLQGQ